jgi:hypothetical protein
MMALRLQRKATRRPASIALLAALCCMVCLERMAPNLAEQYYAVLDCCLVHMQA